MCNFGNLETNQKPSPFPLDYTKLFRAIILLASILIAGCLGDDMAGLRKEVAKINARKNTNVAPLPEFKHIPSYFYEVENMRDPFLPFMESQQQDIPLQQQTLQVTQGSNVNCPRPDPYRVRAGLELFPLDALQMVGTVEQDKNLWALIVASDNTIYRVQIGDYMGQNSGKIINIEENKIELLELIPNKEGCWTETLNTLNLSS